MKYAAIGIDPRAWRGGNDALSTVTGREDPVEEKLGLAVKRLRLYWGWSQQHLEYRCSVDQTTLSRLERGLQPGLSIRRLFAILRALRVGEVQFLPRTPIVPPTPLELMLHGDPWKRAMSEADRRVNRRRSA
jgi:transcriptional regulator with XRE-family HTH domain